MRYEFVCDNCKNVQSINIPMDKISETEVFCNKCNNKMHQHWSASLIVPDYMRAVEDEANMDWVKERMKNRPSGKDRIYY